jgi:PurA ssDNA and RNA-binding protein
LRFFEDKQKTRTYSGKPYAGLRITTSLIAMIPSPSPYDRPKFSESFAAKNGRTLATEKIEVEYKIFFLDLQDNHRGRFLRITEDAGGRRETIIIPIENAREFTETFKRIIAAVP